MASVGRSDRLKEDEISKGAERRRDIIQAAFALIAEKGVEGFRIRDVATRMGINIGTLYYYYPTREGLIQGVVDFCVQHITTVQNPETRLEAVDAFAVLRQHFADLVYQLRYTPAIFRVMTELLLRAERNVEIQRILLKTDEDWYAYLFDLLTRGIQDGSVRQDLPVTITARSIMSFFKGIPLSLQLSADELPAMVRELERWIQT